MWKHKTYKSMKGLQKNAVPTLACVLDIKWNTMFLLCFFRDLKPENILLDDNGKYSHSKHVPSVCNK